MHIAVCDDNVADRKQLERLLGRESDVRKSDSGVFYTDSFGTFSQMYPKRMAYDLFFIDIVEDGNSGLDLALKLINHGGVSAPVILCSSKIDYSKEASCLEELPENLMFLDKPIRKAELSAKLDKAVEITASREGRIELRHRNDTSYVHENDIVYIREHGRYLDVFLTGGQMVSVLDSIENFYSCTAHFPRLVKISSSVIVNITHLESYSLFGVTLKDGTHFKSTLWGHRLLRITYKYLKGELLQ